MKKIKTISFIIFLLLMVSPMLSSARIDSPEKVIQTINKAAGWMYSALVALAVVFIIYAGYIFLSAGGKEENITKAKNQILYAVAAVVTALLATGIVKLIEQFLETS